MQDFFKRFNSYDSNNSKGTDIGNNLGNVTAFDIFQRQMLQGCILSYNIELDAVLKGELLPGTLTELTGLPGSGKTHVCFQLCITVQFPEQYGGLNGEALYVNTNSNFASHMLKEFADGILDQFKILKNISGKGSGRISTEDILKSIYSANISDCYELLAFLKYLETFLKSRKVRLVIIDSIASLLRKLCIKNRTSITYNILQNLQDLARKYNFAVVITNDMTTRVNKGVAYYTPSFGDSFYHRVNTRIQLKKDSTCFSATILKSILKPPIEVHFNF